MTSFRRTQETSPSSTRGRSTRSGSYRRRLTNTSRAWKEWTPVREAAAGDSHSLLGGEGAGVRCAGLPADYSGNPARELSIYVVEKTDETGHLCRLVPVRNDLAIHGLEGDIRHGGNVN